jgi:hypothetical protein
VALRADEHENIRRDTAVFGALFRQVKETFLHRDESKHGMWPWKEACRQFHEYDSPMLALVSEDDKGRIRRSDPEYVERAICYLEVDPLYFRSGYTKAKLINCLKWVRLTPWQQARLRKVVLDVIDSHFRTEFRAYCRLAAHVQTEEFTASVRDRAAGPDQGVRERAAFLLKQLEQHNRTRAGLGRS